MERKFCQSVQNSVEKENKKKKKGNCKALCAKAQTQKGEYSETFYCYNDLNCHVSQRQTKNLMYFLEVYNYMAFNKSRTFAESFCDAPVLAPSI